MALSVWSQLCVDWRNASRLMTLGRGTSGHQPTDQRRKSLRCPGPVWTPAVWQSPSPVNKKIDIEMLTFSGKINIWIILFVKQLYTLEEIFFSTGSFRSPGWQCWAGPLTKESPFCITVAWHLIFVDRTAHVHAVDVLFSRYEEKKHFYSDKEKSLLLTIYTTNTNIF